MYKAKGKELLENERQTSIRMSKCSRKMAKSTYMKLRKVLVQSVVKYDNETRTRGDRDKRRTKATEMRTLRYLAGYRDTLLRPTQGKLLYVRYLRSIIQFEKLLHMRKDQNMQIEWIRAGGHRQRGKVKSKRKIMETLE
jgi:hypothetical protein